MRAVLLMHAVAFADAPQEDRASSPGFFINFVLEGTADAYRHADAVVYLRIEDTKPWSEGRIAVQDGQGTWLNLGRDTTPSTESMKVEDFLAKLRAVANGKI